MPAMPAIVRRVAAIIASSSPLVASASVLTRSAEASEAWHLLGAVAPVLLWGLPLAYVVFTVVTLLPPFPRGQKELERPRDGTFVDRLSLFSDPRDGW
jgi:hypothetical protein